MTQNGRGRNDIVMPGVTMLYVKRFCVSFFLFAAASSAADLTGNWLAATPNNDGTSRKTYLNLKQEGDRITGTIRTTQFWYSISDSKREADGYTLTAAMLDGNNQRRATFQLKLAGDEVH